MKKLDPNKVKIGIAPIGWTNDDLPELGGDISFDQCINEMSKAGYVGCEVGNKFPKDPYELKKQLDKHNLQVCNAWYSTYFTVDKKQETIEGFIKHRDFLHAMGAKVIGVSEQGHSIQGLDKPLFDDKPTFTDQQWQALYEGLNELAALAEEKDMKVCFHEHNGTGVQTNLETIKLLENTNPNVYLLLDTGHVYLGNYDSSDPQKELEDLTRKYAHRITHVHVKDVDREVVEKVKKEKLSFLDGVKLNMFVVPGNGVINFAPIFEILAEHDYQGWLLVEAEGDPSVNIPLVVAKQAREFINKLTGL